MVRMLVSNCCSASAFFGWGESYGMQLTEDGTYIGMCGDCREHAEFYEEEGEEENEDNR